jgi:hypothetical protein
MIVIVRSLDRDRAASARHPVWPLFDLRVRTRHLTLRVPGDGDLAGLVSLAGRSGWSASGPEAALDVPQYFWRLRADWSPRAWRLPLVAYDDALRPRGVRLLEGEDFASTHAVRTHAPLPAGADEELDAELLRGVLALAFEHLGALSARAGADDPPALLERHGFTAYGVQRRLALDGWLRLGDAGVEVDRLDRSLFGLAA